MPDAAVVTQGGDVARGWLSAAIPNVRHWDLASSHLVTNHEELGRFLALDAIIFNEDRHGGNILLQVLDEQHLRAWIIDCGEALVGQPTDFSALQIDAVPAAQNIARGLPVELLAPGAEAAAVEAQQLEERLVREFVAEACEIADSLGDVDTIAAQFVRRCARAKTLTQKLLGDIEKVYRNR